MAEKSIIFSTEMVRAILEGRKTQERRVIKPQLNIGVPNGKYRYDGVQEGIHAIEMLKVERREAHMKWCKLASCWCSDVEEIYEGLDCCDLACDGCEECEDITAK